MSFDCFNEIFEYVALDDDKNTLYSCLFVNRFWCEVSVRILWRKINFYSILIACLPNDSKKILNENGIIISTPTSKPPIFNYAEFCKFLSVNQLYYNIISVIQNNRYVSLKNSKNDINKCINILMQEICKFLMNQTTLKKLIFLKDLDTTFTFTFTFYPGMESFLKNLSELYCSSSISSDFFCQLSKICHNIQLLSIEFDEFDINILSGLIGLISSQKNLKSLMQYYPEHYNWIDVTPLLTKLPNTLTKLHIYGGENSIPLSYITKLTNLQELQLSFDHEFLLCDNFEGLKYANIPQLQILKFGYTCPRSEDLIKFLKKNGKNLKEFYIADNDNSINLTIAEFCPNLRKLSIDFECNELETLKIIFKNCQYLESIEIFCDGKHFTDKKVLKIIAKYSPKNFYELKLLYNLKSKLLPRELEDFFVNWTKRIPKKSLSLIMISLGPNSLSLIENDKNMKIIEKYIKSGDIKKLKVDNENYTTPPQIKSYF